MALTLNAREAIAGDAGPGRDLQRSPRRRSEGPVYKFLDVQVYVFDTAKNPSQRPGYYLYRYRLIRNVYLVAAGITVILVATLAGETAAIIVGSILVLLFLAHMLWNSSMRSCSTPNVRRFT